MRFHYPGQEEINDGLTLIKALLACEESYTFIERFNERKDELLDFSDNYHDLEHFYEHQKPTWEKLRTAHTTYTLNRSQLECDAKAAPALRRIQDIITARSPYGLIQEAEGLITAVEGVNTALLAEHRTAICQKIDDAVAALTKDIEAAQGGDTLRAICLRPLAKLRVQVEGEASIAPIIQAEQQALTLFDTAQDHMQEFVRKATEKPSGEEIAPAPQKPTPVVKKVHPIKPAAMVKATYLETLDDVHGFLDHLRTEMEDAIHKGERSQIR